MSSSRQVLHLDPTDAKKFRGLWRKRSSRTIWPEVSARETDDRAFVAKWSTRGLDSVLYHCATPQIAQQLERFGNRPPSDSTIGRKLRKFVVDQPTGVRMHQFVSVHCAGGSHPLEDGQVVSRAKRSRRRHERQPDPKGNISSRVCCRGRNSYRWRKLRIKRKLTNVIPTRNQPCSLSSLLLIFLAERFKSANFHAFFLWAGPALVELLDSTAIFNAGE
jgi:hypothetical protein